MSTKRKTRESPQWRGRSISEGSDSSQKSRQGKAVGKNRKGNECMQGVKKEGTSIPRSLYAQKPMPKRNTRLSPRDYEEKSTGEERATNFS